MIRTVVSIIVLFILLLITIVAVVFVWKVYHGLGGYKQRVIDYFARRKEAKQRTEANSQLPEFMQEGIAQFDASVERLADLPIDLQEKLLPLTTDAEMVMRLARHKPKLGEQIRTFFSVSIPAYVKLVDTLSDDHALLSDTEKEKVDSNITLLRKDFGKSLKRIETSQKLKFDVVMESIKQRIKHR